LISVLTFIQYLLIEVDNIELKIISLIFQTQYFGRKMEK